MKFKKISRISDDDLRLAIGKMSEDEKEDIISKLEVTHQIFQNWLDGKAALGNARKRNQLIHLIEGDI